MTGKRGIYAAIEAVGIPLPAIQARHCGDWGFRRFLIGAEHEHVAIDREQGRILLFNGAIATSTLQAITAL